MQKQLFAACLALLASTGAHASETVTYRYDSLGRLIQADQTNGAAGHRESLRYDVSGNRTTHIVEGSPNGPATGVIVTRLGRGFALVPFDRQ